MLALYAIPVVAVLYALPMLFGWAGPNRWYGFRHRRALANREIWYAANRIAAMHILVAMAVCLMLEFAVPALHGGVTSHVVTPLLQISALVIANALTLVRLLRKSQSRLPR
jgi:hypothetical protein